MRTLLRVAVTAGFCLVPVLLVGATLPDPARSQNEPVCATDFSAISDRARWQVMRGDKLRAYLARMFAPVPDGDAMAYMAVGEYVALVLARDGCVVGHRIVPTTVHESVVLKVGDLP